MIQVYTFKYEIDGFTYGGTISAMSVEHAKGLVPWAREVSLLHSEYHICEVCRTARTEEWAEVLEG